MGEEEVTTQATEQPTADQSTDTDSSSAFEDASSAYLDDYEKREGETKDEDAEEATSDSEKPAEVSKDSVSPKPDQGKSVQPETTTPGPEFEVGSHKIRAGDKLTNEAFQEIQKGYLRQADYTRKTQELKPIRDEALGILATRDQILNDPSGLRQVFGDEHVLNAFHPHEILNHALESNGVDPEAWNTFLTDYEQAGGKVQKDWKADPYAKRFDEFEKKLKPLEGFVSNYEKARVDFQKRQAAEKAKAELNTEIDAAMKKFHGVTKKDILVGIVSDQTDRTVEQIAQSVKEENDGKIKEYQKTIGEVHKQTKSAQAKGNSVPIMRKPSTSFEGATEQALEDYAAGRLQFG